MVIITIVCDFGHEDVSYVIRDNIFLKDCIKHLFTTAIESVIHKIYFSPEHPENHSIKMQNIKENQVIIKQNNEWFRKHISDPAHKMVYKGQNILQTYYFESGEAQKTIDRMMEQEVIEPDKKLDYLNRLSIPDTTEHKQAVSQVKGVISNYKLNTKLN